MKTARVHLRLTENEKTRWGQAAARDGFFHNGEPNVSGWLRALADREVEAPKRKKR